MKTNLILGARLEIHDFQRGGQILPFNPDLTKDWEESAKKYAYNTYILYITQEETDSEFNLGANKIFFFLEYLKSHRQEIDKVLLADMLDVVFLKGGLFEFMQPNTLYIGDEPCCLGIDWIKYNSYPLLAEEKYSSWLNSNSHLPLLNTGLIGGDVDLVIDILERIAEMLRTYTRGVDIGADMFCLNYTAYNSTYKIVHGEPFNTIFKSYDILNTFCYVSHK